MTDDPNTMLEFTPENLRDFAKKTDDLRADILFGIEDAGADPESELQFLLALSHLETAQRHFSLASLKQSQALAAGRR